MDFFVPTIDGSGHMMSGRDEKVWVSCRREAEVELGQEALDRRVYRLEFKHDGPTLTAQVGKQNATYCNCGIVTAIIAFQTCYKICCVVNGYLTVGATPTVELQDALDVEDFD